GVVESVDMDVCWWEGVSRAVRDQGDGRGETAKAPRRGRDLRERRYAGASEASGGVALRSELGSPGSLTGTRSSVAITAGLAGRKFRDGSLTPEQLTGDLLERIERENPRLNAFYEVFASEARESAARAT